MMTLALLVVLLALLGAGGIYFCYLKLPLLRWRLFELR